jgi:hypothetical protein
MTNQLQTLLVLPRLRRSESLAAIISQGGPLPEEQVWNVVDKLLERLETLHAQGKCHRVFSSTTIGIDASGELEIASTDAPLSISELVRLHVPLPSCLRHEFELVIPANECDAATVLSHAGFAASGAALDLFQVAVLTIRLIFDVDAEKFLASPCLDETLSPELSRILRGLLIANDKGLWKPKVLRGSLPGAANNPPSEEPETHAPESESRLPVETIQPTKECNCTSANSQELAPEPVEEKLPGTHAWPDLTPAAFAPNLTPPPTTALDAAPPKVKARPSLVVVGIAVLAVLALIGATAVLFSIRSN